MITHLLCLTLSIYVIFSVQATAADFQPTVLQLSVQGEVEYAFDGKVLDFTVAVEGLPAAAWLVINTSGKDGSIADVRNGFLGWHYVNGIDTTVYISERQQFEPGSNVIHWDGCAQDGSPVPSDEYSYYVWGYDDQNDRKRVSDFVRVGFDWDCEHTFLITHGEDGFPLDRPFLFGSQQGTASDDSVPYKIHGTHFKWIIGGDPHDVSNLQTTWCAVYKNRATVTDLHYGGPKIDPDNYGFFYHCQRDTKAWTESLLRWQFVEDGEAILDTDWPGSGVATWEYPVQSQSRQWFQKPAVYGDDEYMYVATTGHFHHTEEWNKLKCISYNGELVFNKMMHDWYYPDDGNELSYVNGHIVHMATTGDNRWLLMGYNTCLMQMINTSRLLTDPADETDMVLFENANGDHFMDADTSPAWHCLDYEMRRDSISIDANGFSIIGTSNYGLTQFGVMTQDGTGIGRMSFVDDVVPSYEGDKFNGGGVICDTGSNFDGLYFGEALVDGGDHGWNSTNYVGFDSVSGIIKPKPASVGELVRPFLLTQNTPNPFNQSTSISFNLTDEDNVNLYVYNVAGQQVVSLVEGVLPSGQHTVTWDADGFPTGIYFYKISTGNFEKTMKMTLLK